MSGKPRCLPSQGKIKADGSESRGRASGLSFRTKRSLKVPNDSGAVSYTHLTLPTKA